MQKQAAAHNQQTFLQRSHEQALNQYQQHSDELKNVQERLEKAQQNADQQVQLVIAAQKEQQAKAQQLDQEKAQQAQLTALITSQFLLTQLMKFFWAI